jgi:hypothetical protein
VKALPPPPLKPILRSSISAGIEGKQGTETEGASNHRTSSSAASSASSKQISFLLPESPMRWGAATAPEFRDAARHSRQNNTASCSPAAASSISRATIAISAARPASGSSATETARERLHTAAVTSTERDLNILNIKAKNSSMHVRTSSDVPEVRRSSLGKLTRLHGSLRKQVSNVDLCYPLLLGLSSTRDTESLTKELPPLPLNASAPASSASFSSHGSSRQSGHVRGESASSAASSVLSNPIHLPRLKLGDPSLGNLFAPSLDSPQANRGEDRTGYSPFDDKKFAWMGLGRKRDSSESKRSSKRRSDSSVVASLHSIPMNKHQRSRSSQLGVVYESDPADSTLKHTVPVVVESRKKTRPTFERNLTSNSKDEAARMTELWVTLLEDFVLLCDDPSRPSSQRSSTSSYSSSYIAPPSPSQFTPDLLLPPGSIDTPCPTSPSPSSECDPFLRLPSSARRKFAPITKPLPPSPMPSLEVDDSVGSTTCTQSPSTPAETQSPGLPSRVSYNPFEASFGSIEGGVTASTSTASASTTTPMAFARRSSMPTALGTSSGTYGGSRPGKSRPPPLNLPSVSDSNDSIHTAVPPQTEAQTHFYTSQRSRSLPTSKLEPGSYRQPISPSKRDLEAEQLGASTSSTGSNRASRRYHFPSSYGAPVGVDLLNTSTTASICSASARRRNKSIDEGYSGTGLTPTPTSDTFSIPSRSRETSVSSTSEALDLRRRGSCTTAKTSLPPSPTSTLEGKRTPDNNLSKSQNSNLSSNTSTPQAKRYTESTRTRSKRSQSASEHIRKKSNDVGPTLKRSPTSIEIVMYGVAL